MTETSAADLDALLEGRAFNVEDDLGDLLAPGGAVQEVASRIAGQYAEVLASFAQRMFRQQAAGLRAIDTVAQLRRLAFGAGNHTQVALLDDLIEAAEQVSTARTPHVRQLALNVLRDWIPSFADTLQAEDGALLRAVVDWDAAALPLLTELRRVYGIGPRRLGRLYSAGLHSLDVVASADPNEVSQVTGLTVALATEVVCAARRYAISEQLRCATEICDRTRRLALIVGATDAESDPQIVDLARSALSDLKRVLQHMEGDL